MANKNRNRRTGKSPRQQRKKQRTAATHETQADPYAAPVIENPDRPGTYMFDLDATPPIPPGAIRANPRRQVFCCSGPQFWWRDTNRKCVQCGDKFIFTAEEQKFWFEELQFHQASQAIRCARCRKQRRTIKAVQERHALVSGYRDSDDDGEVLEYVSALVDLIEKTGNGNPAHGVAAARRARRLNKELAEPLYWEARAQLLAGHNDKAEALLREFLAHPGMAQRRLRTDAEARLNVPD